MKGECGGGGSSSTPTPEPEPTPAPESKTNTDGSVTVSVTATLDTQTGAAKAVLTANDFDSAVVKATADTQGITTVNIEIPETPGAVSYETELPTAALAANGTTRIEIRTEIGTITAPGNMLGSGEEYGTGSVGLSIGAADTLSIDETVRELKRLISASMRWRMCIRPSRILHPAHGRRSR
ncbi:hypothetical protein C4588_07785 [Candidatus Parcubacteria bacterium]|nr:MAG: hypothetical protein C4588_07785 [Candidatus Parcubacteria bacterium]